MIIERGHRFTHCSLSLHAPSPSALNHPPSSPPSSEGGSHQKSQMQMCTPYTSVLRTRETLRRQVDQLLSEEAKAKAAANAAQAEAAR